MSSKAVEGKQLALELAVTFGATLVIFLALVRPWFMTWGASVVELGRALPGDMVVPTAAYQATRALTINAPVDRVWPWVAQLGRDRGGFYSYELLEDLAGAQIDNADAILAEHQAWRDGDALWMYPEDKLEGAGKAPLVAYEPGHVLVFGTHQFGSASTAPPDGTWAFVVEPVGSRHSRLIVRSRGRGYDTLQASALSQVLFDPIHFVMERRMMLGIKQRAEGRVVSRIWDDLTVLLWVAAFVALVAAGLLFVRRMANARSVIALGAMLVIFQVLTLVQPHFIVGLCLLIGGIALMWVPRVQTLSEQ